ncbi:MFS transporter, partial [Candidatus Thorarchaeota archaeon]
MQERTPLSRTTKYTVIVAFILFSAYNLVLAALQDYVLFLSNDQSALGISFGIFALSAVISRFISGRIIERIDDALALVFGNIILTIALGTYSIALNISVVYLTRAIQGFGWALSTVTVLTMISENTESARVSEALGYLNGFGSLSLMLFPVFGSWIVALKNLESFIMCFQLAFSISLLSVGFSVYAWKSTPTRVEHEKPISGLPERMVMIPTLSAIMVFVPLGLLLSYSPEIAALNAIQNPGTFFFVFAFAQIIGSFIGGVCTGNSHYRWVATIGALFVVCGVMILVIFGGILGYIIAALTVGFGLAITNIALNSYVSLVSRESDAKGMAIYSAGVDSAIAGGSFSTA